MRAEREEVGVLADDGHLVAAEELDRDKALPLAEIQLDRLQEARQVGDAEDLLRLVAPDVCQHLAVFRTQQLERATPESAMPLAQGDQPLGPRIDRVRVSLLRLDVHRFVVVLGVSDHGQVKALPVGAGEARVAVGAPLHRGAHPVAVTEKDVVAHADLVAVVEDGCARE